MLTPREQIIIRRRFGFASALLAAPAMAVAGRVGIPALLMAIMAGNGALAGTLSPFAPGGIVANDVMSRIGLDGLEWQTYGYNVLAHLLVGMGGFVLFGGLKLFRRHAGDAGSVDILAIFDRGATPAAGGRTATARRTAPCRSRRAGWRRGRRPT